MEEASRTCVACGQVARSDGDALEACSACGALFGAAEPGLELLEPPGPAPEAVLPALPRRRAGRRKEPPADAGTFTKRLPTVFLYPFSSMGGILFLALTAPIWAFLNSWYAEVTLFGLIGQVLVGGYIASYMFLVLLDAADGGERAPIGPGVTDVGDLVMDFFRFFLSGAAAFGPWVVLMIYGRFGDSALFESGGYVALLIAAGFLGILYYPMSLMLIGFSGSLIQAFNYPFGIRSLLRIPRAYFICCVFFLVTFGGAWGLETYQDFMAGKAGGWGSFAAALGAAFWTLYFYMVQMRALGLLYITNRERLAWFRR